MEGPDDQVDNIHPTNALSQINVQTLSSIDQSSQSQQRMVGSDHDHLQGTESDTSLPEQPGSHCSSGVDSVYPLQSNDSGDATVQDGKGVGLRRSACNRCSARKERCDGNEPCERCMAADAPCEYATTRKRGRPKKSKEEEALAAGLQETSPTLRESLSSTHMGLRDRSQLSGPANDLEEELKSEPKRKRRPSTQQRIKPTTEPTAPSGAAAPLPVVPLRAGFSPSPATGLAGLVQNRFLTCYIEDFGFMYPVVDDSVVREALVNIITGVVPMDISSEPTGGAPPGGGPLAMVAGGPHAAETERRRLFTINTVMWAGLTIGAILQGLPRDRLSPYVNTTVESLRRCFHHSHTSTVQALVAVALMFKMLQDEDRYTAHLGHARSMYDSLSHSSVDLDAVFSYRDIMDRILNANIEHGAVADVPEAAPLALLLAQNHPPAPLRSGGNTAMLSPHVQRGGYLSTQSIAQLGGRPPWQQPHGGQGPLSGEPRHLPWEMMFADHYPVPPPSPSPGMWGPRPPGHLQGYVQADRPPPQPPMGPPRPPELRLQRPSPVEIIVDVFNTLGYDNWEPHRGQPRPPAVPARMQQMLLSEQALLNLMKERSQGNRTSPLADMLLSSIIMLVRSKLRRTDGMVDLAENIAQSLLRCPGLPNLHEHSFHMAAVLLRQHGRRQAYEQMRSIFNSQLQYDHIPSFEQMSPNVHCCTNSVCQSQCDLLWVVWTDERKRAQSSRRQHQWVPTPPPTTLSFGGAVSSGLAQALPPQAFFSAAPSGLRPTNGQELAGPIDWGEDEGDLGNLDGLDLASNHPWG